VDEIVGDWHADTKDQAVGILLEHGFHVSLGFRVKRSVKVGCVLLGEADAGSLGVLFVINENATGGVDGAMDATLQTQIGKIQSSNDVGADGFGLVGLAPVNVGTPGDASGVEDVSGLVLVELLGYRFAVLETAVGGFDLDGAVCTNGWSRNFCLVMVRNVCVKIVWIDKGCCVLELYCVFVYHCIFTFVIDSFSSTGGEVFKIEKER